jgi:DNA gyrase subunit B
MYLGAPLTDPVAPTLMLREAFCLALDDALGGCCIRIDVRHWPDGAVSVADDGAGIPHVASDGGGRSEIDVLMTELYSCRERKKHRHVAHNLCGAGLVVANALSERAVFDSYVEGSHWRATYARGRPVGEVVRVADTNRTGKTVTIRPDRELIANAGFDFEQLAIWLASLDLESAAIEVTLQHLDGATQTLLSTR